jgi:hypothetical protein
MNLEDIKELQNDVALSEAELQTKQAQLRQEIFKKVVESGGTPGVDFLCLKCGALSPTQEHVCADQ